MPTPKKKKAPTSLADLISFHTLADLPPYEKNARTHPPEQLRQLRELMLRYGFTSPVLADSFGIVAGHGRVMAAAEIYQAGGSLRMPGGLEIPFGMVPVLDVSGWSEEERRAYIIADNQSAQGSGWDLGLLGAELRDLNANGFDMAILGFGDMQLNALLMPGTAGRTDPNSVPEVRPDPVSVEGDVWILGRHRLVCGDATMEGHVAACLNGVLPHLMVTDPPYGVDYDPADRGRALNDGADRATGMVANDRREDWTEAFALFPGAVAYIWHGDRQAPALFKALGNCAFKVRNQIVWVKTRPALSRGHYHSQHEKAMYAVRDGEQDAWQNRFEPEHETALYAVKDKSTASWHGDRKQSTVWFIEHMKNATGHGTQKPVECMKRPIENNSSAGQAIYEPFSGSGTTIIAAEMTGRVCHAIEILPQYVDVAVRRWQEFTGGKAVHADTGLTFDELEAERLAPKKKPAALKPKKTVPAAKKAVAKKAAKPKGKVSK